MHGLSTAVACLGAITFYVGFYHLLFYLQSRERREHLAFALSCLSVGFYDVACAGLYAATTIEAGAAWQYWQFVALTGTGAFTVWFTSEFVGRKSRRWDYLFYAYWAIQAVVLLFGKNQLEWHKAAAEKSFIFFGTAISYHEVEPGALVNTQSLIGLATCLYILNSLIAFYHSGKRHESGPIILGMLCLVGSVINDTFVSTGIYKSVYLIEYGYMCMVLAMAYSLTRGHLRTQKALRTSEEKYRSLINSVPDVIYTVDTQGHILSISSAGVALFGYAQNEMIGQNFLQYLHPDDASTARKFFYSAVIAKRSNPPGTIRLRALRKDGTVRWIAVNGSTTLDDDGEIAQMQGIIRDVTENCKAKEDLARLAAAVNAADESIVITDTTGAIQYVNPCFEQMTGYSRTEIVGKNPRILNSGKHDRAFYAKMWTTISSGETWRGHFTNRKKDGTLMEEEAVISPVRDSQGKIVNYVAVKRDVTQQRVLESQLRHSQTMEAIGRLAKGIAHDFTNMLVIITNSAHLAKKKLAPIPAEVQLLFDNITTAANKAGELTSQLMAFTHQQTVSLRDVDLNKCVHGIEDMVRRTLEQNVRFAIRYSRTPSLVKVDPGQIEQAIIHLVVNACDAMPNGGHLTLETSHLVLSPAEAVQFSEGITRKDVVTGPLAVITVSDTGAGISSDIQPHIFEPFFTTKGKGKSTGLGLSTVYGIARMHGGAITVYSNPGTGSTFALYLPLTQAGAAAADASDTPTRILKPATVLLIEEDPLYRGLLAKILKGCGYAVLETENAKLALDLAQDAKAKIDLVMCDLLLAGTDGRKFADNLKRIHPQCKAVFLSGYPAAHLREQGLLKHDECLLARPFAASVVEPVISSILAG